MDAPRTDAGSAAAPRAVHRLVRIALALALVAALAGTFRLYLGPDLRLDLGAFAQWCGLR
ncbi:MAG: hypothetical protein NTW15_18655 [Burkholderiales bacterium]|nr:hypothetical protein [Burkholderiales bacterium]